MERSGTPFEGCSCCDAPLRNHEYRDVAVVALGSPEAERIVAILESERWESLGAHTATVESSDSVVFRILRCPVGTGLVVCLRLTESAVDDDVLFGTAYQLNAHDLAEIDATVPDEWRRYSTTWLNRGKRAAGEQEIGPDGRAHG
jgi:hypothetical protein